MQIPIARERRGPAARPRRRRGTVVLSTLGGTT